jgi:hypothetical protein
MHRWIDPNSRGDFDDLVDSVIPQDFWTIPGIDWVSNALTAHDQCYCDVSMPRCLIAAVSEPANGIDAAEFVGNLVLVKETAEANLQQTPRRTLGRPPAFAWEAFHVEVADLVKSGRTPQNKEAAIQQMMNWFETTQGGKSPSRSDSNRAATANELSVCCPGAAPKNAGVRRPKIAHKFQIKIK